MRQQARHRARTDRAVESSPQALAVPRRRAHQIMEQTQQILMYET